MEHIEQIQEIVDENKQQMPTGVATAIMKSCQDAYQALPKLYKVKTVVVTLIGGELQHHEEPVIVEECNMEEWMGITYRRSTSLRQVIIYKKMPKEALHWAFPEVDTRQFGTKDLQKTIIVDIQPYHKRSRD